MDAKADFSLRLAYVRRQFFFILFIYLFFIYLFFYFLFFGPDKCSLVHLCVLGHSRYHSKHRAIGTEDS